MEKEKTTKAEDVIVNPDGTKQIKAIGASGIITIVIFVALFGYLGVVMGADKMFSIMLKTAFDVLINTSFYIMAVAIVFGAVVYLWSEFGVIAIVNRILAPLMRPLFGLPGAAALGAVTCYCSDNPAILAIAQEPGYDKYFTPAEKLTHVNFGTVFGMGLIVTAAMLGLGGDFFMPTLIGNIAAILGGIVSVRLTLNYGKKFYNEDKKYRITFDENHVEMRKIRGGSVLDRGLQAAMDGARSGLELGLAAASGTVFICTFIMILTFGPAGENGEYLGVANEGVRLLPRLAAPLTPVTNILFGFSNPEVVVFPLTALGAVGSAVGLTKGLVDSGAASMQNVCVFVAMGICWSGFLSVHVGEINALKQTEHTGKMLLFHLIGGLAAGVFANYIWIGLSAVGVI